jgi:hypothetical protein
VDEAAHCPPQSEAERTDERYRPHLHAAHSTQVSGGLGLKFTARPLAVDPTLNRGTRVVDHASSGISRDLGARVRRSLGGSW